MDQLKQGDVRMFAIPVVVDNHIQYEKDGPRRGHSKREFLKGTVVAVKGVDSYLVKVATQEHPWHLHFKAGEIQEVQTGTAAEKPLNRMNHAELLAKCQALGITVEKPEAITNAELVEKIEKHNPAGGG
jgi:hypothetical protein